MLSRRLLRQAPLRQLGPARQLVSLRLKHASVIKSKPGRSSASSQHLDQISAASGGFGASYGAPEPLQSRMRSSVKGAAVGFIISAGVFLAIQFVLQDQKARKGHVRTNVPDRILSLRRMESEDQIDLASPMPALTLAEAETLLRMNNQSNTFVDDNENKIRIDTASVPSNVPVEDHTMSAQGFIQGGSPGLFAGVYDGHAGWATSVLLCSKLIPYVSAALANLQHDIPREAVEEAIKRAFVKFDDRLCSQAEEALRKSPSQVSAEALSAVAPVASGSCAIMAIFDPKKRILRVANTGDSRAVLGTWSEEQGSYVARALTKDHTGFNEGEKARIAAEHPDEDINQLIDSKSGRLLGIAVTRAFGDARWKMTKEFLENVKSNYFGDALRPGYKSKLMTAEPEVTTIDVQRKDFVILASDGLWDVMSNEDAVAAVGQWLKAQAKGERVPDTPMETKLEVDEDGWPGYKATPEYNLIGDYDCAAAMLVRNALGGRRTELFRGAMTQIGPGSRSMRDDISVHVIFFFNPEGAAEPKGKTQ